MKNKLLYLFALLSFAIVFGACKKEYETIETVDQRKIDEYLSKSGVSMTKDPSGFYFTVLENGTGDILQNTDSVFFGVDIKSLTGKSYFTTPSHTNTGEFLGYMTSPRNFYVGKSIVPYPGTAYRTALNGLRRGSKVRFLIPSYMAFGKNGDDTGAVPSNEILLVDVMVYKESKQYLLDDARIQQFLTANSLTATKQPNRVYTIISQAGTGTEVTIPSSTIEVRYTARLIDGTVVESVSGTDSYERELGTYIKAWAQTLLGYTAGTKIRLITPSDMAYGNAFQTAIPPNSVLDFDVEIIKVTN